MGPLKLQRSLKIEEEPKKEGQRDEVWEGLHHSLLSLKMLKDHKLKNVDGSRHRNKSFSTAPEESSPVDMLILAHWDLGQDSNI